ncbi:MAG: hypothetical protein HC887_00135 [Desulfobacteraceae bacterium]|nr:hypothetical protein [Desulfobacteraceae bacterium]
MEANEKRIMIGIVILTGIFTFIIHRFCLHHLSVLFESLFGEKWISQVHHRLVNIGIHRDFILIYAHIAMTSYVPEWCLVSIITFCLGVNYSHLTKIIAISLVAWFPIVRFILNIVYWLIYFRGTGYSAGLFSLSDVFFSLITIIFGIGSWGCGALLSRFIRIIIK